MLKRFVSFLFLAGMLAGFIALASCNGNTPPIPPYPTPPPPAPGGGWSCANPPQLVGEVAVKDSAAIPGRYNVRLKDAVGKASAADAWAASSAAAQRVGAKDVAIMARGRAFAATLDVKAIVKLRSDPSVQYFHKALRVSIPRPVRPIPGQALLRLQDATSLPGLDRIGQRDLPLNGQTEFYGNVGANTVLVSNDTGVYAEHEAFTDRVQKECFTAVRFGGCADRHGHGTHTTATAAGVKWGGAIAAKIFIVRTLDENGSGSDTGVAQGLDWTAELKRQHPEYRIVTNLSLGGSRSPTINSAVCAAKAAGVVVVVAAGNDYGADACDGSPSGVLDALVVGAMQPRNDDVADFSNAGSCVDLYAPGVDIESAWISGGSETHSGSSMSAPHVSLVALLYLATHPNATPDEVHDKVIEYATQGTLNRVPSDTVNKMLFVVPAS